MANVLAIRIHGYAKINETHAPVSIVQRAVTASCATDVLNALTKLRRAMVITKDGTRTMIEETVKPSIYSCIPI